MTNLCTCGHHREDHYGGMWSGDTFCCDADCACQQFTQPKPSAAITFRCPLPPAELHQNSRCHWRAKAAATALYRKETMVFAWEAGCNVCPWIPLPITQHRAPEFWAKRKPAFERAVLALEFVVPDKRRRDVANYLGAFKSGIDGIVDAGLIRDDSSEHLKIGRLDMRVRERGEEPCVVVTLEAADA